MDSSLQPPSLSRRLASLASGRKGLAVGFWGQAGIGKSHQATLVLGGLPFVTHRMHASSPPSVWASVLGAVPDLPTWASRTLERSAQGEELSPESLATALTCWLEALAPTVLYLEDLHEASPQTQQLWQLLAQRVIQSRAVGLLVSSRSALPEPFEAIALQPLSLEQSAALLQGELGTAVPAEALEWIYQRALGNPLFTLEYFRFLARMGNLWSDGRQWHWRTPQDPGLPTVVEALIAHQLQSLEPGSPARWALVAKTRLPQAAPERLWADLAGLSSEALQQAKNQLVGLGILHQDELAHPLFGEVFEREITPQERQQTAQRALAALSEQPTLAAQFIAEAGLPKDQAISRLCQAAAQAPTPRAAASLLAQAVEYAEGSERAGLALQTAKHLKEHAAVEALAFAEQAYRLNPSPQTALMLCDLYLTNNQNPQAEALFHTLSTQDQLSPEGLGFQMRWHNLQDRTAQTVALWQQHRPRLEGSASAVHWVVHALRALGDAAAANALVDEVLSQPYLKPQDKASLVYAKGNVAAMGAQFQTAIEQYSQALALYGNSSPYSVLPLLTNRAMMHTELGQYDQATADMEAVLALAGEVGDGKRRAKALQNLGYVYTSMQDFDKAETTLLEARQELSRFGLQDTLTYVESNLSDLYREWDVPYSGPRALRHGRAALALAQQSNDAFMVSHTSAVAAQAEAKFGVGTVALDLAEKALQAAQSVDHPLGLATGLQAHGLALRALGRTLEAQRAFAEAGERFEALGMQDHARQMRLLLNPPQTLPTPSGPPSPSPVGPALQVLGPMQASGKPVSAGKLQELLALLLEARIQGQKEVSQLELFEALYPESPEAEARRALQQLVYRLRQHYGPAWVLKTPAGYALGEVTSDAEEFVRTGDLWLWRGVYLEGCDYPGQEAVRSKLQRGLFAATEDTLPLEPETASKAARILYQSDPYSLEALALLLKALQASQDPSAPELYRQAQRHLAEVGEPLPPSLDVFLQTRV